MKMIFGAFNGLLIISVLLLCFGQFGHSFGSVYSTQGVPCNYGSCRSFLKFEKNNPDDDSRVALWEGLTLLETKS